MDLVDIMALSRGTIVFSILLSMRRFHPDNAKCLFVPENPSQDWQSLTQ